MKIISIVKYSTNTIFLIWIGPHTHTHHEHKHLLTHKSHNLTFTGARVHLLLTCLCNESSSLSIDLSIATPVWPLAIAARSSWLMYIPRGGRPRFWWRPPALPGPPLDGPTPRLPPPPCIGPHVGRDTPVLLRQHTNNRHRSVLY